MSTFLLTTHVHPGTCANEVDTDPEKLEVIVGRNSVQILNYDETEPVKTAYKNNIATGASIKIDDNERRIGLSLKTSREPSRAGTASGVSIQQWGRRAPGRVDGT